MAERKRNRINTSAAWEAAGTELWAWDQLMERFHKFKYLGCILLFDDNNWTAMAGNLLKAGNKWGRFYYLLVWEGDDTKTSGMFYVAVVQYFLLLESETWVVTT